MGQISVPEMFQDALAGITRRFVARSRSGFSQIRTIPRDPRVTCGSPHRARYETTKSHVNWVVLDSDWEGELCRVVEKHPRVLAYAKNHNLGLELPYPYGSESRTYVPDFILLVDDGRGWDDPLHLVIEIKGYRGEDAKEKKSTI